MTVKDFLIFCGLGGVAIWLLLNREKKDANGEEKPK